MSDLRRKAFVFVLTCLEWLTDILKSTTVVVHVDHFDYFLIQAYTV